MTFAEMGINEFQDALAASSPTPGGGSAAALTGATAACAVEMVCRVTQNDDDFEDVHEEMTDAIDDLEAIRTELNELADEDAAAFDDVMEAYRRPSDDADRSQAIQTAMTTAAEVPLQTAEACLEVIEHAAFAAAEGNQNAVTDAGTGALLAHAAARSALYNVDINLASLDESETASSIRARRESVQDKADSALKTVEDIVSSAV